MKDVFGVVHHVFGAPQPFATMSGGMPGQTMCVTNFYYGVRGPMSCSWPGAVPMDETDAQVDCMICLVREARR